MRRTFLKAGAACGVQLMLGTAHAQPASGRPMEWVVGFAAGGGSDAVARGVAEAWAKPIHRNIVVINKPGAGTNIAAEYAARSRDYGNLVFTAGFPTLAANPHLFPKLAYNAEQDFVPISLLARFPLLLVVNNELPVRSLQEFAAWAKANPGKLSYGSTGTMTSPHLTMELAAQKLGMELLHVPYKGSADLMQAILGGQLMAAADSTGFAPQVEAGKLRVLNTWGAERLAKFPDAPTLKELGLDLVQNSPFGIGAPKGTPPAVVKRLHDAFKQAMEQENYRTALARYDMVPIYMSSATYQKFAADTFEREKALVEKLGLAKPQ